MARKRGRSSRKKKRQKRPTKKNRSKQRRSPKRRQDKREKDSGRPALTGRVQKNPRGFAFILPDEKGQEDVFVSAKESAHLLTGDRVQYQVRPSPKGPAARNVRVTDRKTTRVTGTIERYGHKAVLVTKDADFAIVKRVPKNMSWAIGEIVEYPTRRELGRVKIVESLGDRLGPEHDIPIVVSDHNIPTEFPNNVLAEADRLNQTRPTPTEARKDLRDVPLVTIDGADAKDFDDAVAVRSTGQGFVLYVAIADVSHYVQERSTLDKEALYRSTSVYFPGTCIPMLPEALSNDLCSLRPKENRYAMTAEIHYDRSGTVRSSKFYESLIRTHARLTYEEVEDCFQKKIDLKDLQKSIEAMRSLYRLLKKKRADRGTLDFDLTECLITMGKDDRPVSAGPAPRYESHRLIEEFMIAANEQVAKALARSKQTALYRVHEAPDQNKVEELLPMLKSMGLTYRLRGNRPKEYAQLLEKSEKLAASKTIHQFVLRLQKQARYDPTPLGHFGLALSDYTHFTSPIRRYPDLVVHRALKRMVGIGSKPPSPEEMEQVARQTSDNERRAMEAERAVVKRKQCWFLEPYLGEEFETVITGITETGLFAEIEKYGIEGFVSAGDMKDYYEFDARRHCLMKRPGNELLRIGDRLKLIVKEVSPPEGRIFLSQVSPEN